ncbi:MAG TPA: sulfatase [Acidobacteria bacterium]|nr:sulfatase [Acidobacteriota bacterium]
MDPILDYEWLLTRRHFLEMATTSVGVAALATLFNEDLGAQAVAGQQVPPGLPGIPHFAPKAKRVIYLFQSGAPSQHELFDYKPSLARLSGTDLPPSVRGNQRLTTMTAEQQSLPIVPSVYEFSQHGQSQAWISELMPYTAAIADDLCFIKSMHTEAINHDPGITFFQTGAQLAGRPSIGAWLSYGLGSMNQDLPTFVAMVSVGSGNGGQPLYDRLWGSGFLPTEHQGVKFLPTGDPVLFLSNPPGVDENTRRRFLDDLAKLNQQTRDEFGDPETSTRIAQYEMAYRMQTSVPELTDLSDEPDSTFERYGPDSRRAGSFARNCLIARRLAERDVRFIQLFHRGWDQHTRLPSGIRNQARDVDQPQAALVTDLKERGLLDDTLVVWGGEFGRTPHVKKADGRDHNSTGFTFWMAGGGVKGGLTHGTTDDYGIEAVGGKVHFHDLHATMLHLLGLDHKKLTYRYAGRDFRLTDVHGNVVNEILV